jgi:hypothetical protein
LSDGATERTRQKRKILTFVLAIHVLFHGFQTGVFVHHAYWTKSNWPESSNSGSLAVVPPVYRANSCAIVDRNQRLPGSLSVRACQYWDMGKDGAVNGGGGKILSRCEAAKALARACFFFWKFWQ